MRLGGHRELSAVLTWLRARPIPARENEVQDPGQATRPGSASPTPPPPAAAVTGPSPRLWLPDNLVLLCFPLPPTQLRVGDAPGSSPRTWCSGEAQWGRMGREGGRDTEVTFRRHRFAS